MNQYPVTRPVSVRYEDNLARVNTTDTCVVVQPTYTVLSAHRVEAVNLTTVEQHERSTDGQVYFVRSLVITTANGARITVDLFGNSEDDLHVSIGGAR